MCANRVEYLNENGQFSFDDTNIQLLCNQDENVQEEMFVDEGTSFFVIQELQDGQYLIPADGQTVLLQDNSNEECNQIVFNNIDDLIVVDEPDEMEQTPEILEVITEDSAEQIMYYTNEMSNEETFDSTDNTDMAAPLLYTVEDTLDETPVKRFKFDNLVSFENLVETSLDENTNEELQLDEDGADLSSLKYQYAVLKDGKLHLQMCNPESLGEDENELTVVDPSLKEQIDAFQESITMDESNVIDLSKITGRNLITGQTVTLDNYYLNRIQEQMNINELEMSKKESFEVTGKCNKSSNDDFDMNSFLNKKLVLGKTSNGKKLVGKILEIHIPTSDKTPAKESSDVDVHITSENKTLLSENLETNEIQDNPHNDSGLSGNLQELFVDSSGKILQMKEISEQKVCIKKRVVSQDTYDYVTKTFVGLMEMESIQGRLVNKRLVVKVVEKIYDSQRDIFNKNISYIYGYMQLQPKDDEENVEKKWNFVVSSEGDDENVMDTVPLTFIITVDKSGKKSTRVTICPRSTDNKCIICGKEFKSSLHLRRHVSNYHQRDRTTSCDICSKTFSDQRLMHRHRRIHTGERWYECPTCNKNFNSQGSLKRHLSVHDPNLRPLQCTLCLQRFTDQSSLKKHLLIHTGIKAYQCSLCLRSFVNQGDLNFHMRIHDPLKQFTCDTCGRQFSRHANLLRHMEIHRGNGDLYRCDICGCSYNYISSLTRHVVQNHISKEQT